jgi:hypothetical protein
MVRLSQRITASDRDNAGWSVAWINLPIGGCDHPGKLIPHERAALLGSESAEVEGLCAALSWTR